MPLRKSVAYGSQPHSKVFGTQRKGRRHEGEGGLCLVVCLSVCLFVRTSLSPVVVYGDEFIKV